MNNTVHVNTIHTVKYNTYTYPYRQPIQRRYSSISMAYTLLRLCRNCERNISPLLGSSSLVNHDMSTGSALSSVDCNATFRPSIWNQTSGSWMIGKKSNHCTTTPQCVCLTCHKHVLLTQSIHTTTAVVCETSSCFILQILPACTSVLYNESTSSLCTSALKMNVDEYFTRAKGGMINYCINLVE